MATQEVIVDQKPVDLAPVDPNVVVPKHVREAAARAEATYQQAYSQPQDTPAEPAAVPAPEVVSNPEVVQAPPAVEAAPAPTPPPAPDWEQRYNSMKGRWQANERMLGEMRTQMDHMATELQRTQALMQHPQHPEQPQHEHLITQEERETYGDDMLNVARKVAIEALQPEIQRVQAQNEELKQQLLKQGRNELLVQLSGAVPNWRAIVNTQEWKDWLRLPNVYTGEVRGRVLDAAHKAANAPRVIAIFNEYVRDTIATGGQLPGAQVQEQPVAAPPREPAIPLASIAAPGRAKPASGELPSAAPVGKPTYTRQQIARFYEDSRRGAYNGRETEKARLEADIYAAQREGRVR